VTTFERFQAKMATLPSTRDGVHTCSRCGAKAVRFHDIRATPKARRQFIKCDECGREVTIKLTAI
jgi:transcription elongation factor Elf1